MLGLKVCHHILLEEAFNGTGEEDISGWVFQVLGDLR